MIKHLKHHEIDKQLWDMCIAQSQYPIAYACSWFLDSVSPHWEALIVSDEIGYTAVFPLTTKNKFGLSYLVQPPFCQQLGLFYTQETHVTSFIEYIEKKYRLVEIALNHHNYLSFQSEKTADRTNLILDLKQPYQQIYNNYTTNRKRDLKKAQTHQLVVEENHDIDFFVDFFRKEKGLDIKNLGSEDFSKLRSIFISAHEQSACTMYFVRNKLSVVTAVGLFIKYHHRIIYLLGTSNKEGQKNGSMTALMDCVIRKNTEQAFVLDFEGSSIMGLAKFYESLGGKEKKYISLKANRLWVLHKIFKKIKDLTNELKLR